MENVKVGDLLLISTRTEEFIRKVERITPTLVITDSYRFCKRTGRAKGLGDWSWADARIATEDDFKRIEAKKKRDSLLSQCDKIRLRDLTDTQLQEILNIACPKNEKE